MNEETITYDKAKWHFGGDYPVGLPQENAYTHTGMFLVWLVDKNLLLPDFAEDFREEILQVRERVITPGRFFEILDGVFASDMLNDEGNKFSKDYFDFDTGKYLRDYSEVLVKQLPSTYHVEDTWGNYNLLQKKIDNRYVNWQKSINAIN